MLYALLRWLCSNGNRFCGRWHFDEMKQQWKGNPADSAEAQDIMSSLKHKTGLEDGNQTHLLPMTKDFMDHMLEWSLQSCPSIEWALSLLQQAFSGEDLAASDLKMD